MDLSRSFIFVISLLLIAFLPCSFAALRKAKQQIHQLAFPIFSGGCLPGFDATTPPLPL